ncbi:MAG: hypothetical protein GX951_01885 [Mollicutes bacterium]|nr:hypothetical protein [Mollicutes bacterium]
MKQTKAKNKYTEEYINFYQKIIEFEELNRGKIQGNIRDNFNRIKKDLEILINDTTNLTYDDFEKQSKACNFKERFESITESFIFIQDVINVRYPSYFKNTLADVVSSAISFLLDLRYLVPNLMGYTDFEKDELERDLRFQQSFDESAIIEAILNLPNPEYLAGVYPISEEMQKVPVDVSSIKGLNGVIGVNEAEMVRNFIREQLLIHCLGSLPEEYFTNKAFIKEVIYGDYIGSTIEYTSKGNIILRNNLKESQESLQYVFDSNKLKYIYQTYLLNSYEDELDVKASTIYYCPSLLGKTEIIELVERFIFDASSKEFKEKYLEYFKDGDYGIIRDEMKTKAKVKSSFSYTRKADENSFDRLFGLNINNENPVRKR